MTGGQQPRWSPDEHLVASILANGPVRMSVLGAPDRCWAVAGLTLHGLTAEEIADRLGCSLRLVRAVRAEDMTQVCLLAQREACVFDDEARLLRSELRTKELERASAAGELDRVREQLARLLEAGGGAASVCGRCANVMDRYNTYVHPATGKSYCRACRRENQKRYYTRNYRSSTSSSGVSTGSSRVSTGSSGPTTVNNDPDAVPTP